MGSANDGHIVAAVDIGTTKVCTVIAEIKENEININAFEKDLSDLIYLIGANNNLLEKINYQKNT